MILFAGACGLASFLMMQAYSARIAQRDPGDPVPVVLAARTIERGTALTDADLSIAAVPSRYAPPDAFTTIAQARARVALAAITAGEVVTSTRVSAPGGGPIAALVPEGLRAIVVPSGLPAGTVQAGDHVSVLVTRGEGGTYSETVAEGLEVLQVLPASGSTYATSTSGGTLALLVDPLSAEDVATAIIGGAVTIIVEAPSPSDGG